MTSRHNVIFQSGMSYIFDVHLMQIVQCYKSDVAEDWRSHHNWQVGNTVKYINRKATVPPVSLFIWSCSHQDRLSPFAMNQVSAPSETNAIV